MFYNGSDMSSNRALIVYVAWIVVYRVAENVAMQKAGTTGKPSVRDWTAWLIIVPYYLILIDAPAEHLYVETEPRILNWVLGSLCFLAATGVRTKAHFDLQKGFSMFLETLDEQGLVTEGLYSAIRHPLYLGNLLLFIACPLFLAGTWSWLLTALGIAGILVRIPIEERFLAERFEDYTTYKEQTAALIPGIY